METIIQTEEKKIEMDISESEVDISETGEKASDSSNTKGIMDIHVGSGFGENWMSLIRIGFVVFVTFVCCILFFFLILRYSGFANIGKKFFKAGEPIFIGLLLAYLMNPIMKGLEQRLRPIVEKRVSDENRVKKISRVLGITGSTIFLLLVLTVFGFLIIPSVINSITHLVNQMPSYVNIIINFIENGSFGDGVISEFLQDSVEQAADYLEEWFDKNVLAQAQIYIAQITTGVYNVAKTLINFIIGIIVMDYVMAIQATLSGQVKKIIYCVFKSKHGNVIIKTIRKASSIFGGFITGKIIDSVIIGVIAYIGCSIMKTPDTVLVTVIIGVTNVIPFFGPFIGAVPSLLLVLIQDPWHALYLLIFILVLQQVDGNIIGPKILGTSTGLSSFWVMVAILIGGGLFGIAGMIFGVPVFAVIYYIIQQIIERILIKKGLPTETIQYTNLDSIDPASKQIIPKKR